MIASETDFRKTVRLLVPDSWTSDERGAFLEEVAKRLLKRQRYKVTDRIRFTGMEIDLLADHIDTAQRAFVECKFVRDPLSANVVDLLIGKAVRKNVELIYLFSTAPPGKEAKGAIDELKHAHAGNSPALAFVGPEEIADIFIDLYDASPTPSACGSVTVASLIISPHLPPFWALEQNTDGIPTRALIVPVRPIDSAFESSVVSIFREHDLYQGLELVFKTSCHTAEIPRPTEESNEEIVTPIAMAESLEDYRPCRPQDFVGRNSIQKKIWEFLERVRQDETPNRIIALSGPSGFGKSSIVLKLADRFCNHKWKKKFFLFPVDARSARGPLFVAKALKTAIHKALDSDFIRLPSKSICIETTESLLQSDSIKAALQYLKRHNRVLLVFFDQFEELLTKEELLSTFEGFKRLAFEVHSVRENIVLGFSWRTGITFSDDNPAYHVWHSLKDLRYNLQVDEFLSSESSELVGQFERELSQRLLPPLRRRLLEQGQGMPWLLKKLCIHIYREILKGTQQEELLSRRLNVKALFDEDTQPLTEIQIHCLRYIASNSPADIVEVFEHFDQDTVNRLYNQRLIIRAGQRYAVYWDIFRDYLVEGIVPTIPWTYVPQSELTIMFRAFQLFRDIGPMSIKEIADKLRYAERTAMNLLGDLHNLLLVHKEADGRFAVRSDVAQMNDMELAGFVKDQMKEHIVIYAVYKSISQGQSMSMTELRELIEKLYASTNLKADTIETYLGRLVSYLRFSGLLDVIDDKVIRPKDLGKDFGRVDLPGKRRGTYPEDNQTIFACSASPDKVILLAKQLADKKKISKSIVLQTENRNAAADLIALGLASWVGGFLIANSSCTACETDSEDSLYIIIKERALQSKLLVLMESFLKEDSKNNTVDMGHLLANKLGRKWSDTSAQRYASAGRRWWKFFNEPPTP